MTLKDNNFDILFQNKTQDEIGQYLTVLRDIRKGAKSKKQKIKAMTEQMKFVNLMFNAGHEMGGSGIPVQLSADSNEFLQMFHRQDINSLWREMHVPANKTSSSILGDVKNVYGIMKYLDFTSSLDDTIALDKALANENEQVGFDMDSPPPLDIPDSMHFGAQEYNKQRRAFHNLRKKKGRIGKRGDPLPIPSGTPEPQPSFLNNNNENDDVAVLTGNLNEPQNPRRSQQRKQFDKWVHSKRNQQFDSDRSSYDSDSDTAKNRRHMMESSSSDEQPNHTPKRKAKPKRKARPKPQPKRKGRPKPQKTNTPPPRPKTIPKPRREPKIFSRSDLRTELEKHQYDKISSKRGKKDFLERAEYSYRQQHFATVGSHTDFRGGGWM